MHFYHRTILNTSCIIGAALGDFLGDGASYALELYVDTIILYKICNGKTYYKKSWKLYGVGRCIRCLHINGYYKDVAVLTSDSGCLSIVEYNNEKNELECIYMERFGAPGCLRKVPGQYLEISPDNKYIIVGAVERSLIAYRMKYDVSTDGQSITISSICKKKDIKDTVFFDMVYYRENGLSYVVTLQQGYTNANKRICFYAIQDTIDGRLSLESTQEMEMGLPANRFLLYNGALFCCLEGGIALISTSEIKEKKSLYKPLFIVSYAQYTIANESYLCLAFEDGNMLQVSSEKVESMIDFTKIRLCVKDMQVLFPYLFVFSSPFNDLSIDLREGNRFKALQIRSNISSVTHAFPAFYKSTFFVTKYQKKCSLVFSYRRCIFCRCIGERIEHIKGPFTRLFCITSLTDPMYDSFCLLSSSVGTFVIPAAKNLVQPPFLKDEGTVYAGSAQSAYFIQITTKRIRLIYNEQYYDWLCSDGDIVHACMNDMYVYIATSSSALYCFQIQSNSLVERDKEVFRDAITSIQIYKANSILISLSNRAMLLYTIEDDVFKKSKSYSFKKAITALFSFHPSSPYIYAGTNDSELLVLFINDNNEIEEAPLFTKLLSSKEHLPVLFFRHNIRGTPALVIEIDNYAFIVLENDPFHLTSLNIVDMKEKWNTSAAPLVFGGLFRKENLNDCYVLYKNRIMQFTFSFYGDSAELRSVLDEYGSIQQIHPISPIYMFVSSVREEKDANASGGESILTNHRIINVFNWKETVSLPMISKDVIVTASMCYEWENTTLSGSGNKLVLVLGLWNGKDNSNRLQLFDTSLYNTHKKDPSSSASSVSSASSNSGLKINESSFQSLYSLPLSSFCSHIAYMQNDCMAAIVGQELCIYCLSPTHFALLDKKLCTSSCINEMKVLKEAIYLIDNTGVISVYSFTMSSRLQLCVSHATHRSLMHLCVFNASTVVVSDKMGNICVYQSFYDMRCMKNCMEVAPMTLVAATYLGAIVTSLICREEKPNSIMYMTITGKGGIIWLIKDEAALLAPLEEAIMSSASSLTGRVIRDYRNSFLTSFGIIDGDLCRQFLHMDSEKQQSIANSIQKKPADIQSLLITLENQ